MIYRRSARPMHISVACMRLDIGVMNNLALCKVNAPLTIVELTDNRYAGYARLRSALLLRTV
jgi:hypothetical protein